MQNVAGFKIDPSMYTRSTPKSPLDPGTAEFVKPVAAMVQAAEMTTEQFKSEARAAINNFEAHCARFLAVAQTFKKRWHEFGPTQDLACSEVFGCSLHGLRQRLQRVKDKVSVSEQDDLTPEEDKKNTLTKIADLPDPLAECEAKMAARAQVTAGANPPPETTAPKAVPEAEPEPVKDKTPRDLIGYPIPAQLMDRWNQRQEVQDRITAASR